MSPDRHRASRARLNVDVEILKLAHLVGCEPQDLGYLARVDPQDVHDLREQVTVVMFDADRQMFQRVAAAARLLPTRLVAVIGERAFGPLLCARITGLLEPSRAVDVAARLPTPFLAELAVALDPRRASRVIARIPPSQVAEVTTVLAEREEYVTMGAFVGHLSDAALRAAIAVLGDEELLRTAYVVESTSSLGALVATLPEARLRTILATATEADLWIEALDVLGHLDERQRGQLGDLAAGHADEVLDGMVRAAQRALSWDGVLAVTHAMSPQSRARFAALRSIHTRPVLASMVDAASRHALWPELLQLAIELERRTQVLIASLLAASADDGLDGLLDAVWEQRLEPELAHLLSLLPSAELGNFAPRLLTRGGDEFVAALREAAQELELHELGSALA